MTKRLAYDLYFQRIQIISSEIRVLRRKISLDKSAKKDSKIREIDDNSTGKGEVGGSSVGVGGRKGEITSGDVYPPGLFFPQRRDDAAQGQEALVDVHRLTQSLARDTDRFG